MSDPVARLNAALEGRYDEFYTCSDCHKLYWKGSHYRHMQELVRRLGGAVGR